MTLKARDRASGRYVDTKLDKLCVNTHDGMECGHPLGEHTAERRGGLQPCVHGWCECPAFKKGLGCSAQRLSDQSEPPAKPESTG